MPIGSVVSHTTTRQASLPTSDQRAGSAGTISGAQRGWWLEDALPGTTIVHPGGRTISEAEHVWLAWVTHNLSDIHGNADAARRTEWGEPLVLGMLTAAIVIGLAEPATGPPETVAEATGSGWDWIRLEHVVTAGDTLRANHRSSRSNLPASRATASCVARSSDSTRMALRSCASGSVAASPRAWAGSARKNDC